ncbi:MAG: glycoside hydrolase family 2 TIM barrel-domain containing protein [Verrucomicrobiota bacterium]
MSDIFIRSNTAQITVTVHLPRPPENLAIFDSDGNIVVAPVINQSATPAGAVVIVLDASRLSMWTPERPVLYFLKAGKAKLRFGYNDITTNSDRVLVNGAVFYFRGYIRGIAAHDHPNLTGASKREFYRKNILQAKKYGFNLVRFHSTIPDEEFVNQADELGLFVHIETGYNYEFDDKGLKTKIAVNAAKWRDTIVRFRNHPSLAIFCLGNEMHNAGSMPEVHAMYRIGRELAPHKLVMDNAGWGEFDRTSTDIFTQHVAYFFPFKHHQEMFDQDFCWEMNGSVYRYPLSEQKEFPHGTISVRRALNPIRPVMAHECVHYIDIPDYAALNEEFNLFCRKVGLEYLAKNHIEKPRYMTELPALIAAKKLGGKMPDYILASQHFKKLGVKTYLERLRRSGKFCGYEILQFADCLKYENKNGIVDCFDNDKFIDAEWFRNFNSDRVILADFPKENFARREEFDIGIYLSNYCPSDPAGCILKLYLASAGNPGELVYSGQKFMPVEGLAMLVKTKLQLECQDGCPTAYTLEAELSNGQRCWRNQWSFWVFPPATLPVRPEMRIVAKELEDFLHCAGSDARVDQNMVFTDVFNDSVLDDLKAGKTVILNYHRDREAKQYYLPGALDRFKPCIWDRGNNLGGIVTADFFQQAMGSGRYFDLNYYYLVEGGYKINLDHFPFRVNELIWGVDKPVRDRMKGLIHGIKDFRPDDTLRNFSYLFNLKVAKGHLVVCTFNFARARLDPATASAVCALIGHATELAAGGAAELPDFKAYLVKSTQAGIIKEDVMNHFWEMDDKPVEDTLFWEEARVDLSKIESPENK